MTNKDLNEILNNLDYSRALVVSTACYSDDVINKLDTISGTGQDNITPIKNTIAIGFKGEIPNVKGILFWYSISKGNNIIESKDASSCEIYFYDENGPPYNIPEWVESFNPVIYARMH
jgi:hypothetical protein